MLSHEFDRTAADLILMVEPLGATNGNAVVLAVSIMIDKLEFSAHGDKGFTSHSEKCGQINAVGELFLLVCICVLELLIF